MDDLQFYPTPPELAERAWSLFRNRRFERVLEPEAGRGDLIRSMVEKYDYRRNVDCLELDIRHHPTLRELRANVLGFDFLSFDKGAQYSHIIMNPPFAEGVQHVLHAWDILWDGEIVAILNAETIRNPFSRERQHLVNLIKEHGSVEFVEGAFSNAERKTNVEVALIHLEKKAESKELLGTLLSGLRKDSESPGRAEVESHQDLAVPNSSIENAVLVFNAAWTATQELVRAEARAEYYSKLIGPSFEQIIGEKHDVTKDLSAKQVRRELHNRYDTLKNSAWANILQMTDIQSRMTAQMQSEIQRRFEQIKSLDFTVENIRGFLSGLVENQGEIQVEMLCGVFDEITKYHTGNRAHYRGWKSNDKHRTCGMRIKNTRFILPYFEPSYGNSLKWEAENKLRDFDKAFALLDGNPQAEHFGLLDLFQSRYEELKAGNRLSCDFFDVRYYFGTGTIHFFPGNRKHIDRLNMIVGRHRQWLPPEEERVDKDFWLQYEDAEKFDKEITRRAKAHPENKKSWRGLLYNAFSSHDPKEKASASALLDDIMKDVQQEKGIDIDTAIEHENRDLPALIHQQNDLFAA
ncbi:DUF4942 domain-containing protein [Acidihalobacter ferrooxydans]|uniref:DUF4942 domain-containing protein n=1 Tax=Acidihalobacter ferrooxydans TaxID=1765967 RepID=A0A1P8UF94_9GAMM|nr:DUF4942 domain-containing protein [Acidihalobacter ferrooxydans]APZ42523.1 hypothetical protein BW247_04975 [Acidihalobacter ferrooxydans]